MFELRMIEILHDHSNYTRRRVQVMKLLIMQFSPTSCHFIPLRSKYSPQHPVLKHPQKGRTLLIQKLALDSASPSSIRSIRKSFHVSPHWPVGRSTSSISSVSAYSGGYAAKAKLSLLLVRHENMKAYGSGADKAPRIANHSTIYRWRWVVGFMPRPLYSRGENFWDPFLGWLDRPQSWHGNGGESEDTFPVGNGTPILLSV
jgi:hypothetical protein